MLYYNSLNCALIFFIVFLVFAYLIIKGGQDHSKISFVCFKSRVLLKDELDLPVSTACQSVSLLREEMTLLRKKKIKFVVAKEASDFFISKMCKTLVFHLQQ